VGNKWVLTYKVSGFIPTRIHPDDRQGNSQFKIIYISYLTKNTYLYSHALLLIYTKMVCKFLSLGTQRTIS